MVAGTALRVRISNVQFVVDLGGEVVISAVTPTVEGCPLKNLIHFRGDELAEGHAYERQRRNVLSIVRLKSPPAETHADHGGMAAKVERNS